MSVPPDATGRAAVPPQSLGGIFLRFLRFGALAWGGPVAQIAGIRQELVDEEHWISPARFNRVLAVYQALPGPEAHELCVYFGMVARGRPGALLAGLGFMLPGFLLMLALSWWYVAAGIDRSTTAGLFAGFQAAVAALIVRAVYRIGIHAIASRGLLLIGVLAAVSQLASVHFMLTLAAGGLLHAASGPSSGTRAASLLAAAWLPPLAAVTVVPGMASLFGTGLRSGLLTFGGAYTVIPFLQHDAVTVGGWMTNQQFLDGLALSSILPAPLVIFATFVGYVGGGLSGALVLTAGIFLPAFTFTMIGHRFFERLVDNPTAHRFLDGVTAAVIGLIAVTAWGLARVAVTGLVSALVFAVALLVVSRWRAKGAAAAVVLAGGAVGLFALG